mgnify:CR=1 FL=1
MQEKTLFRTALIIMLLGLLLLFFYAEEFSLQPIATLEESAIEETVKISGIAQKVTQKENVTFLEVVGEQKTTMKIVLFPKEEIYVKDGQFVTIEGVIEEYLGEKEIIASSLTIH